ncbi:MAG: hypothetical protein GY714_14435 [Desulfobacterales bacterium]|nr:hypothetical protein [Desulfobacterales bacterium]
MKNVNIGIIGDFNDKPSQIKTNEALSHISEKLSIHIRSSWLPTNKITKTNLNEFDGFWGSPGDYDHPEGAHFAIKYCREEKIPYFGT